MDENADIFANDEYLNTQDFTNHIGSETDTSILEKLGIVLGSSVRQTYSHSRVISSLLTLRNCNKDYGENGGCKYSNNELPEFDRCNTKGSIAPLRRFNNTIGHFNSIDESKSLTTYNTLCFKPEIVENIYEVALQTSIELAPSIKRGKLWNLKNCNLCDTNSNSQWQYNKEILNEELQKSLNKISISFPLPLSAHTHHAWLESQDNKNQITDSNIYQLPQETTAVPGLIGTLQNNQIIDLAQDKDDKYPDIEARHKDIDIPGFLCAGHTAHSTEAGRVRRVCCGVSVRILNSTMISKFEKACEISNKVKDNNKDWTVFCMGKITHCGIKTLYKLRNTLHSLSTTSIHIPTLYINSDTKVALISISSGVLVKRGLNSIISTSLSLNSDPWPDQNHIPLFPSPSNSEYVSFYYSAYFLLVPYLAFDDPHRSLIASVQSIQAVTLPYGAGTSSVSPCYYSKPLVSTPLVEELFNQEDEQLADMYPGENLMIAYANFNDTNEDSIIMSSGCIDRGMLSHMAYSANVINSNSNIPLTGKYAHISKNRWWKSYSNRYKQDYLKEGTILAGGDGRGKVISMSDTPAGQISVKMLRYSTPVTGDKLASGHGQKGVLKIWPEQDMPWGVDDRGNSIKFDMIMSLSSVSNRITAGLYYEMVTAVDAVRKGRRIIVKPGEYHDNDEETNLYSGTTGDMIMRTSEEEGCDIPVSASWGIARIWQMTQLSWDKQHYVHETSGKHSITTGVGRTDGGGVKFGEMENHATDASGLSKVTQELKSRMDLININICTNCDETITTCICGTQQNLATFSIPHSMLVFGEINTLTTGYVTKYKIDY